MGWRGRDRAHCGLTVKSIDDWPTLWPKVSSIGELQGVASGDKARQVIELADEEVVPRRLVGLFGRGRAIVGHAIAAVVEDLAVDLHGPVISFRRRFDMEVIDFGVEQHLLARGEFRALQGVERAETEDFGAERQVADGQRRGLAQLRQGLAQDPLGLGGPAARIGRLLGVHPGREPVDLRRPIVLRGLRRSGQRSHGIVAAAGQEVEHAQPGLQGDVAFVLRSGLRFRFDRVDGGGQMGLPVGLGKRHVAGGSQGDARRPARQRSMLHGGSPPIVAAVDGGSGGRSARLGRFSRRGCGGG